MRSFRSDEYATAEQAFSHIRHGNRLLIGTGCGEPQYLVRALVEYVASHPTAFFDVEVCHLWSLGSTTYLDPRYRRHFRHNSLFVGPNTRDAVVRGFADYTPIFLSEVPDLIARGLLPVDVVLVQASLPDSHGSMSLGVSVDIVKAAIENAHMIIAQVNSFVPRVHGDGFINIDDTAFLIRHDEPLVEFHARPADDAVERIGQYVARILQDGDTIQVGYGRAPNGVLAALDCKKHLGVHTELLSDGIVYLMKKGVVDNSRKSLNRGKVVASFCMGTRETYEYIDDNPWIEFRTLDYTDNPLVIAQHDNMVAINSALEIDLSGQATTESIQGTFRSCVGGTASFMRGAALAKGGKTILVLPSTSLNGERSRVVPSLKEGTAFTLHQADIRYVVTEYGIAYLQGKSVRERAMDLISIAHPKFRPWLLEEAKKRSLVYRDQALVSGEGASYPDHLEVYRATRRGLPFLLRPVKIRDEPLLKEFFYSLSTQSLYNRFASSRKDMPHERLQDFVAVDYGKHMVMLAVIEEQAREVVIGMGQYIMDEHEHWAEVAVAVRDDYQKMGVGGQLLSYLKYLAARQGLLGFTAEILAENTVALRLAQNAGLQVENKDEEGNYLLRMFLNQPVY